MHADAGADVRMRDRTADVVQAASVIRLIEQIGQVETLIGIAHAFEKGGHERVIARIGRMEQLHLLEHVRRLSRPARASHARRIKGYEEIDGSSRRQCVGELEGGIAAEAMADHDQLIQTIQRSDKIRRCRLLIPGKDAPADVLSRKRRVEFLRQRLKPLTAFPLKRRVGNAVQGA